MTRINYFILASLLFCSLTQGGSPTLLQSGSVRWSHFDAGSDVTVAQRMVFSGHTTHLAELNVSTLMIRPGNTFTPDDGNVKYETLLIVKNGGVLISLGDEQHNLGPGSISLVMPNESVNIENTGESTAELYRMFYRSKHGLDADRGKREGGSFAINFQDLEFEPHDRGGLRDYFDRPTAMCEYFEMHVTTLNGLIESHPPHTHGAEEIILMIKGDAQEYISGGLHRISQGDFAFLDSNVPHAIRNLSDSPCMYFAFQWQ